MLLNPLKIGGNNYLLNRGWIPFNKKNTKEINILDSKNIFGTLKKQLKANTFKPENDIEKNYWFTLNRKDIFQQFFKKFFTIYYLSK